MAASMMQAWQAAVHGRAWADSLNTGIHGGRSALVKRFGPGQQPIDDVVKLHGLLVAEAQQQLALEAQRKRRNFVMHAAPVGRQVED